MRPSFYAVQEVLQGVFMDCAEKEETLIRRGVEVHFHKSKIVLIHRLLNLLSKAEISLSNFVKMAFSLGSNV